MILPGAILFVCTVLAFALSSVCGGGASFILIPLLGYLLPGAQVPAALSIGTATSSVSRIAVFYRSIRWEIVARFVPPATPAVWLGAWLLTYINPVYLEWIMGLFLLSNLTFLVKPVKKENESTMPKSILMLIGFVAGFVSGLTGAVGLLFNRFYLRYGLSKDEIIATRAANELLLHLIKLCLYISFGLLTMKVMSLGIIIAIGAIFSSVLIKRVLPYISENIFQKTGYLAMVLSGMFMFLNASKNIIDANQLHVTYVTEDKSIETKMQWRKRTFQIDFEYGDGSFEMEYPIELKDLPLDKQKLVEQFSQSADKVVLEEVYGVNKHYYEVYVYEKGKLTKHDI
ncbi:sulfite exporter TauE/SafE family protein [Cytophaga aurantiaca]|uniref:sulfite exporter TauE/SafE family protein n=1 Tax=Cytophaga aurantiaca TaxID=29530 RepID=UPI0003720AB4|nr:sulfite exporter TauE/SafE family protein [Cytophaga aurantiaca]